MSYVALPALFKYICYGSTSIINPGSTLYVRLRRLQMYILTSKVDPRSESLSELQSTFSQQLNNDVMFDESRR